MKSPKERFLDGFEVLFICIYVFFIFVGFVVLFMGPAIAAITCSLFLNNWWYMLLILASIFTFPIGTFLLETGEEVF
jgi:hypothetical protein